MRARYRVQHHTANAWQRHSAVAQRIGKVYPELSKAHRKAADYVLANVFRAATMTIDELADVVGFSLATANRFAHALGFDGYPAFRAALVLDFASSLAPVEKLRDQVGRAATSAEIMANALAADIQNLEATKRALVPELCDRAVSMILKAERIFVLGFGASAHLAGITAHGLEPYCRNVLSVAGPGGPSQTARQFFKVDQRDLVIAMAFPRYVSDTITLATLAKERGAQLLAFTDVPTSPLVPLADVTLYAQTERQLSPTSDAAALALIQATCDAVAHRADRSVHAASKMTEFVLPWLHYPDWQEKSDAEQSKPVVKASKTNKKSSLLKVAADESADTKSAGAKSAATKLPVTKTGKIKSLPKKAELT
ncbi:MurR/RpiR family transcriptional regulator [Glaciimonas sp. CA11.2]|uniref:MurR/RpiR family transcriptional regulator n=1 Tax=unclassified Glaciimonas TaxID=2644401 RepID=UPI002AB44AE7|nr:MULTISPECIES: MurR/RpiR family transcriptional regulator [unclassified Glaciimonas]MDY7548812.1 MurR/RpiR family transcriptional regulator [Glaciimonas sp. CA11.2]MEB0012459.1 MurR/RpiR family transcriptional regulator [Glaciimonas sp. Cout2]MEB0082612.1 MurR/RpiR family transcriptional regulator [Glaciimonas sp. Gout2]MEB0163890.1 MurR/RpiR family transcriptional regulator [Glaciimonas sp. CA11.2]